MRFGMTGMCATNALQQIIFREGSASENPKPPVPSCRPRSRDGALPMPCEMARRLPSRIGTATGGCIEGPARLFLSSAAEIVNRRNVGAMVALQVRTSRNDHK